MGEDDSIRDIVIETRTTVRNLVNVVDGLAESINGTDKNPGMRSDIRELQGSVKIIQKQKTKRDDRVWQLRVLAITEVLTALGLVASIVFRK